MTLEQKVAGHYETAHLLERIDAALRAAGVDPARPPLEALKPMDEFHIGGLEATEALLAPLGIEPAHRVLDLGCGVGGTARFVASRFGAHVTGVDLTPAFVDVARALSARVDLAALNDFRVGSVLAPPVEDGAFDLAVTVHVGMNIADKPALFAAAARALRPGGRYALFDIMRRGDGAIDFPVPWASTPEMSFVAPPQTYRAAAAAAGLRPVAERDRGAFAVDYFRRVIAAVRSDGVPPVGLHLLMGETAEQKYGNAVKAAFDGVVAPWEMVFEKPA